MFVRGIRGATTVKQNERQEMLQATKELLLRLMEANQVLVKDIASIIFTVTQDLTAEFPAVAARELGWNDTPLLCSCEINVPKSLPKCIRILLLVNTNLSQEEIKHVYLNEAVNLRR